MRTCRRAVTVAMTLALLAGPAAGTSPAAEAAPQAPPLYPAVGEGTSFLDHRSAVDGFAEPEWYEANIGFVDLPDQEIEDTYYYRWRVFKEALKYTGPDDGWIVSEFLGPVGYSAPGGAISAAAGHHIYEGRWLRDTRYLDDYLDYWLRGSGSGPKPATDGLNENTTDWAHQYSFWAADATVARAAVDGRWDFAADRLPELRRQWERWSPQFNAELGLYWQVPVWDAMEYTASSYQSDDPYHGGEGFRPTLNAYQFGDARALARLLRQRGEPGDLAAARRYERAAESLRRNHERLLWDETDGFYKHVMRDGNPDLAPIADREQIGFVPWYFHMAPADNAAAWAQLTDPRGFAAPFGPTTVERRSPWFMHEAERGCCRWSGPSWPYATSQTLTALANLLIDYPRQSYVNRSDYYGLLRGYALTQRKNGWPYVAEAHHPDEDRWLYDSRGHSEDYNHSTFNDLVLSGLVGIRPQQGESVRIAPLAPRRWDRFAAENVPYHGRNLTVLWDRDGSAYGAGAGLSVWLDGRLVHRQQRLGPVEVPVPSVPRKDRSQPVPLTDDLANVAETGFPSAEASHTWHADRPADAIDGQDFHLDVPSTRWTSYGSPNASDWLAVDLGVATRVSDVRISFYDDGGGVRTPDSYALDYRTPDGAWAPVPGQERTPALPERGRLNRVLIGPPVTTDALRVRPVRDDGGAVGITALQSWRPEDTRLTARIDTGGEPALRVRPGATTEVVTSVRSTRPVTVRPRLFVPRGWSAEPLTAADERVVRPGRSYETRWRVHVPAGLAPGSRLPLRLLAESVTGAGGPRSTGHVVRAEAVFDPGEFTRTVWDDDFGGDSLGEYRVDTAFGEPAPALRVTGGALIASAQAQSAAVLAAPARTSGGDLAVLLEPRSFGGAEPEDSMFFGRSDGPDDLVLGWYNNHFGTSGVDVRAAGHGYGDSVTGGCCASVRWSEGDRFAAVFSDGVLTTWIEHDGRWQRLRSAPFGTAVPAEQVAAWAPSFGLRLTGGEVALDRVTVLERPG
ncbi:alpha-galactosidase-like protein [Prauserella shujinwangii]|uniref:Alpha-galactosidase-like protein n=2 Tax=Prauserella shujinwangii TaxID=1453103 RepID=A0A2T0M080_9PSEU|nr:alpha-galactosidase-like protein [Prauserella shujinwangii]